MGIVAILFALWLIAWALGAIAFTIGVLLGIISLFTHPVDGPWRKRQ